MLSSYTKIIFFNPDDDKGSCSSGKQEGSVVANDVPSKALELFSMLKDQKMCGNVWDGLSYCYLLQKKYSDAEEASLHSLEISEYDAPNKYANYISSLLCQNKKSEAVSFYLSLPDKEYVKEQFEKDWNNEMKEVGIDMDPFFELFEMQ